MKHIVNVVGYFSRLTVVIEGVVCCVFMCEASCVCMCVCVWVCVFNWTSLSQSPGDGTHLLFPWLRTTDGHTHTQSTECFHSHDLSSKNTEHTDCTGHMGCNQYKVHIHTSHTKPPWTSTHLFLLTWLLRSLDIHPLSSNKLLSSLQTKKINPSFSKSASLTWHPCAVLLHLSVWQRLWVNLLQKKDWRLKKVLVKDDPHS